MSLHRPSIKFLGHIVHEHGISTDPDKVKAIVELCEKDLMDESGSVPSPSKIRSLLGMVGYYQQFFEGYSSISKPSPRHPKGHKRSPVVRRLKSWPMTQQMFCGFS